MILSVNSTQHDANVRNDFHSTTRKSAVFSVSYSIFVQLPPPPQDEISNLFSYPCLNIDVYVETLKI